MNSFKIQFENCPSLICVIDDTDLGQRYFELVRKQYHDDPSPIFRDPQKYTLDYFQDLCQQAKEVLGWNWACDRYDLDTTIRLHKDIEQYLSQGYAHISAQHDNLLHELHFALHAVESGSRRDSWLQIEWFNDRGFALSQDHYPAKINLEFGDLRLQNPYVGHHPLYLYQQNDYLNIDQTCRFHDFVKPGLNLVINDLPVKGFDLEKYFAWWSKHAPQWVDRWGQNGILSWTGHPVIGKIANLDDLRIVLQTPILSNPKLIF